MAGGDDDDGDVRHAHGSLGRLFRDEHWGTNYTRQRNVYAFAQRSALGEIGPCPASAYVSLDYCSRLRGESHISSEFIDLVWMIVEGASDQIKSATTMIPALFCNGKEYSINKEGAQSFFVPCILLWQDVVEVF